MADFDFDIFVSHASEDKDRFVRPLVEALEARHLAVWYDEHSLVPGASLTQSIDKGLGRSRFGLVVISPAFFDKDWPRTELAALTSREHILGDRVLLPVWLDMTAEEVALRSPLVADRYAIQAHRGIAYTADRVREVVRPGASPIVQARELLADHGVPSPPPSDAWWLDIIEAAAPSDVENTFQEPMGWGRWGFPIPPRTEDPSERGERLAWAAMQRQWMDEANRRPITQMTHPDVVLSFVEEMPGLSELCGTFTSYLAAYAPQLTIPGFGGDYESDFEDWRSDWERRVANNEGARKRGPMPLRSLDTGEEAIAAGHFVQGEIQGPPVKCYETAEYLFWLLSDASTWMPAAHRAYLLQGMADWGVWHWTGSGYDNDLPADCTGVLIEELYEVQDLGYTPSSAARADLQARAVVAIQKLSLPEDPDTLVSRFLDSAALPRYIQRNVRRQVGRNVD